MAKITREQRVSLKRLYDRATLPLTYRQFRKTVVGPIYKSDPCIMVQWCGMVIGIEADGYAHS